MCSRLPWTTRLGAILLGGALLGAVASRPAVSAPAPADTDTPAGGRATLDGPTAPESTVRRGANSRLPYPSTADVWVDAQGVPAAPLPSSIGGTVRSMQVLVFRPQDDRLRIEDLVALCVGQQLLARDARPTWTASNVLPDGAGNAWDGRVFTPTAAGQLLVLGLVRNARTQHQLAYEVALTGEMNNPQAWLQARGIVDQLSGAEQERRRTLPPPAGAVPAAAESRITGVQLDQMRRAIQQSNTVSPKVKSMASVVLAQATAVTLSTWRTPSALTDEQFFAYYTQQTSRRGWGPPLSRDETLPGQPTLLFQRPDRDGVVMVRALPSPPYGRFNRAATLIYLLQIDGKINTAALSNH